jgi:hypothetical protein
LLLLLTLLAQVSRSIRRGWKEKKLPDDHSSGFGKKNMAKRSYSDKEKGEALAALDSNANNLKKTAREIGIPLSTLEGWAKNRCGVSDDVPNIRNEKKGELSKIFESLTRQGALLLEETMSTAKFGELSLSVCQWTDKMQLLSGKPTAINENRNSDNRKWAEGQIKELMEEFDLTREKAIELAKQNAPTIAEWVM